MLKNWFCSIVHFSQNVYTLNLARVHLRLFFCCILGVKSEEERLLPPNPNALYEDQAYLRSQTGTALLDKFTHCLLVKCSSEVNLDLN